MVDVVGKNVPVVEKIGEREDGIMQPVQNDGQKVEATIVDMTSASAIKITKDDKVKAACLPDILAGRKKLRGIEKRFDINGDGKLDAAEKAALRAYKDIKMFDINGDGKLDEAEKAARKAYKQVMKFDFNKNGKLDPEELAAYNAFEKSLKKGKEKAEPDWKDLFLLAAFAKYLQDKKIAKIAEALDAQQKPEQKKDDAAEVKVSGGLKITA